MSFLKKKKRTFADLRKQTNKFCVPISNFFEKCQILLVIVEIPPNKSCSHELWRIKIEGFKMFYYENIEHKHISRVCPL